MFTWSSGGPSEAAAYSEVPSGNNQFGECVGLCCLTLFLIGNRKETRRLGSFPSELFIYAKTLRSGEDGGYRVGRTLGPCQSKLKGGRESAIREWPKSLRSRYVACWRAYGLRARNPRCRPLSPSEEGTALLPKARLVRYCYGSSTRSGNG